MNPASLEQKVFTTGHTARVKYLAPCLCPDAIKSARCKGWRWLQRTDLNHDWCTACRNAERARKDYEQTIQRMIRTQLHRISQPEQAFKDHLDLYRIDYVQQYRLNYSERRCYLVDFLVDGKVLVEVNGDYYHSMEHKIRRDQHLQSIAPLPLVFFWESQINDFSEFAVQWFQFMNKYQLRSAYDVEPQSDL